jgi:glycosyltransferase involved in cell wall biosynthesis
MPENYRKTEKVRISVITPTLNRPGEVLGLLKNIKEQTILPIEVILVDGSSPEVKDTENLVKTIGNKLPFRCIFIRHSRGTAIQRNAGIDRANGDFISFIDDDIRLEQKFFEEIIKTFLNDVENLVGGVAGYITNQHLNPKTSIRWQWYRRLHLFKTYEAGRYDYDTGYPINRYLQPPHNGTKELDFMGAGCAVWRKEVFLTGQRFSKFFTGYGVLEDAHFALVARRKWRLLECGKATCIHLKSSTSKPDERKIARMSAVNYRYVFMEVVPNRSWQKNYRFWMVQFFQLLSFIIHALKNPHKKSWLTVVGKLEGFRDARKLKSKKI